MAGAPVLVAWVVESDHVSQRCCPAVVQVRCGFPDVQQAGNIRTNAGADIDEARRTLA